MYLQKVLAADRWIRGTSKEGILPALGHEAVCGDALKRHLCLLQDIRTDLHQRRQVPQYRRSHHLSIQLLWETRLWADHG